jgi:hypothetical protein
VALSNRHVPGLNEQELAPKCADGKMIAGTLLPISVYSRHSLLDVE